MKYAIIAACGAFTVAGTLSLSAQTPARPQTPQPSTSTPTRTDDHTMTITGCLKAGDGAMSGGSTSTGTPGGTTGANAQSMAGKFMLTNVQNDAMGAAGATAGKPDSSAGAAHSGGMKAGHAKQYVLTADNGVNLQAHVNHQVRVTGKMSAMSATAGASSAVGDAHQAGSTRPGESTTAGQTSKPAAGTDASRSPASGHGAVDDKSPTMTVSSVTMISATCTAVTQ